MNYPEPGPERDKLLAERLGLKHWMCRNQHTGVSEGIGLWLPSEEQCAVAPSTDPREAFAVSPNWLAQGKLGVFPLTVIELSRHQECSYKQETCWR